MKTLLLIVIVFWNVENFFDPKAEGTSASEIEFSSAGAKHWTNRRFDEKASGIAKTLLMISDRTGRLPDVVALEEVENGKVLRRLLSNTLLRKLDYVPVHFESHDGRGIDCALLYRKSVFGEVSASLIPILSDEGDTLATRDILMLRTDSLAVLVNHHPSKLGDGAEDRRMAALRALARAGAALAADGVRVVAGGDFNEERSAVSDSLLRPLVEVSADDFPGTIRFQGRWETIDRVLTNLPDRLCVSIFHDAFLLEPDSTHGGLKPRRTYIGPRYNSGLSDHLPLVVSLD